jgi:hypothetical protein
MKKQKTLYHLVVDRSGSMSDCIPQTVNGFNEQITNIQQMEESFPDEQLTIGLTLFNTEVNIHYSGIEPQLAQRLNNENYNPTGGTALLDAIGLTIKKLENDQFVSNKTIPTTVVVVIITDGHENSSSLFSLLDIKQTIERLEATEKWTFSFIGATLDAVDVASSYNIKKHNSFAFQKHEMNESVFSRLNHSMRSYMDKKGRGEKLDNLFDVNENENENTPL